MSAVTPSSPAPAVELAIATRIVIRIDVRIDIDQCCVSNGRFP